jgi:hypothetical protein
LAGEVDLELLRRVPGEAGDEWAWRGLAMLTITVRICGG